MKKKAFIFKVHFVKAFDLLSWEFLDDYGSNEFWVEVEKMD